MDVAAVADVGNTRVKWGRFSAGGILDSAALPPDDPDAWARQLASWGLAADAAWAVAGVHPARRDRLADWLRLRGARVALIADARQLPLVVKLEHPDRVGIDRLLDAVAANVRRPAAVGAVVVGAGSAVTVNWIDEAGAFRGGAIFPGLRLMAQALHDYTALLPLVEPPREVPLFPGLSTAAAIEAGVFWATAGGVLSLVRHLNSVLSPAPAVFLTGGDAPLLHRAMDRETVLWPSMTLEGIRLTAAALP